MSEKITFSVQGSTEEPYVVDFTLSPFTAACTCQAAGVGLPCRHRIKIMEGGDPGIISGDKSKIPEIAAAAKKTSAFDLLKKYEAAKSNKKSIDSQAEKLFKKYRDARIDLLLDKVKTDRPLTKAQAAMDAAIEDLIPADNRIKEVLEELREIFTVTPFPWGGKAIAVAAAQDK
jgi:hypothetical protein